MTFGVMLSLWNKILKRKYNEIILEFLPQLFFFLCLFGYLILMIFIKWMLYGANFTGRYSEHCAPNLLITFINMVLFKKADVDEKLDQCHVDGFNYEIYMFPGQSGFQKFLIVYGLLMVPIMLFGKPAYVYYKRKQRAARLADAQRQELIDRTEEEESSQDEIPIGEVMMYQAIHTIEYVLGSVSHTASYLRLWALSLAHAQLSEVLWSMVMKIALTWQGYSGAVVIYVIFAFWAVLTISILILMEGLSAFLHTLRLHWVEFQSKFYGGEGYAFLPFSFRTCLKEAAADDKEVMKTIK